ncbi:MAG: C40 family peptidase [Lachnospiraceae bacterium]|nr:C40 family peptidase [Lachnospiraceae bacterium]
MKNNIIKLLIGVVVFSTVAGTTVAAQNYISGLSVGGATLIEGGIVCTTSTAQETDSTKTSTTSSFENSSVGTAGLSVATDASITVKASDDQKAVVQDSISLDGVAQNASEENVVSENNNFITISGDVTADESTDVALEQPEMTIQTGSAPEGSKIAALEETLTAELEAEAQAQAEADSILISAGATDTGLEISLPEEGEEEDDVDTLYGYTNLGIAIVDDHLNVRETADDNSKIVGKMSNDSGCEILEVVGNKAHIVSGSVEGYVSTDYILTGDLAAAYANQIVKKLATVSADGLKVRTAPDLEAEVVNMVAYGEELEVVEELDGWVKVLYDGQETYVNAEYVTVGEDLKTALNMSEFLFGEGVSDVRVSLCEYAKQFLGNPYVWGGTSLTKGADCSGYVLSIFGKYGYSLPHSSRAQANMGTKVSLAEAKPGDLVFYSKGGRINHVAIYIGGGQVVHASSPKYGIRITSVYYRTPTTVRRIIQD